VFRNGTTWGICSLISSSFLKDKNIFLFESAIQKKHMDTRNVFHFKMMKCVFIFHQDKQKVEFCNRDSYFYCPGNAVAIDLINARPRKRKMNRCEMEEDACAGVPERKYRRSEHGALAVEPTDRVLAAVFRDLFQTIEPLTGGQLAACHLLPILHSLRVKYSQIPAEYWKDDRVPMERSLRWRTEESMDDKGEEEEDEEEEERGESCGETGSSSSSSDSAGSLEDFVVVAVDDSGTDEEEEEEEKPREKTFQRLKRVL
jgi:hypothetical protein